MQKCEVEKQKFNKGRFALSSKRLIVIKNSFFYFTRESKVKKKKCLISIIRSNLFRREFNYSLFARKSPYNLILIFC